VSAEDAEHGGRSPATIAATWITYLALSFFVVAMKHRAGSPPAVDQDQDPDQRADARKGPPEQRVEVIHALADSDGLGPGLGDL
jgi:hypothetical protein